MLLSLYFLLILSFRKSDGHNERLSKKAQQTVGPFSARRILRGTEASDTRPYMVYLRPVTTTPVAGRMKTDENWLCGGAIIQPRYILTSAACIEDIEHFYVVSGTHKWLPPSETNDCIANGAMKAVWKCVPKTYNFDGRSLDNIRWMINDIAVVMVEGQFNFEKRIKGCDFIPQMAGYNNVSEDMEKSGVRGSIAGWGSTDLYTEPIEMPTRTGVNSLELLETDVMVVKKTNCKNFWLPRYHSIIDSSMICGKNIPLNEMSEACEAGQLNCRYLYYPEEDEDHTSRRLRNISDKVLMRSLARVNKLRKSRRKTQRRVGDEYGGFCENDHGGPLIVGAGKSSVIVGIMTAYRTMNRSTRCVGPFLYTSVWKNRHLISCAIYKELGASCTAILRTSSTVLDEEEIDWRSRNLNSDKKLRSKKQEKKRKPKTTRNRPTTKTIQRPSTIIVG